MNPPHLGGTVNLRRRLRDGVWVPDALDPSPSRPRGGWLGWLPWGLTVASAAVVAGMIAVGWGSQTAAQTPFWRRGEAGNPTMLRDSVIAGSESGLLLYACRGSFDGGLHSGRYRADFSGCHIGYKGHEVELTNFELLSEVWQPSQTLPPNAVSAGEIFEAAPGEAGSTPLYVCRAQYEGGIHPGEITQRGKSCSFGYGGQTIVSANYAVIEQEPWMTWLPAIAHAEPTSSIIGGVEGGEPFFICRASDGHGLHPGKIKSSAQGCSISSAGHELIQKLFEVLAVRWRVSSGGSAPVASLPVGQDASGLEYLCRGQVKEMVEVGRVNQSLAGCHVGMESGETVLQDYEVLTQ